MIADTKVPSCFGFCQSCQTTHELPFGNSLRYAASVMAEFEQLRRLDYLVKDEREADPALHFQTVLPGDRGHMFGVMECEDADGNTHWLRAYSSLGTGVRHIEGWVPYLVDTTTWNNQVLPKQSEIKALTRQRNALADNAPERKTLEQKRRDISRQLMPEIHDLYQFRNFNGEHKPLRDLFTDSNKIPGGVGDCCAPKLLNYAVENQLRPKSIAEFFWGGENKSGRKRPGHFFTACEDKCQPIMGFLLCGLDSKV